MENSRAHSWLRVSSAHSKTLLVQDSDLLRRRKISQVHFPFSSEINGVVWKHMKRPNDTFKALLAANVTEI